MGRQKSAELQRKRLSSSSIPLVLLILLSLLASCQAFSQVIPKLHQSSHSNLQSVFHLKAQESTNHASNKSLPKRIHRRKTNRDEGNWRQAERVEERMATTLEAMENVLNNKDTDEILFFPSVRECNAALAAFGDGGEFLRSLRLFVKMRKAASLANQCRMQKNMTLSVPAPTLVTYSTLMSRSVKVGKPRVALRLWNIMKLQGEFFSNPKHSNAATVLVPDVKAANILMNVYAKLANVEEAHDLMRQMMYGNGTDVPLMTPNLVTYNTLLDACHKADELDAALQAKEQLDQSGLVPDARTYTSLIATVARKASQTSGANDPSLAFSFLKEMKSRNIRPNGMTYSALIDVCGRCRRPDLALQGLRIMLRQKAQEQSSSLPNEVGAWTAAIDACGKSGRIQTARRLFNFMGSFGVQPNAITCGCLTDCLLRNGRTAETLDVLRYMKREGIVPSEVMYTSLISSAGRLVQMENQKPIEEESREDGPNPIEVYTELMKSLMQGNDDKANRRTKGGGRETDDASLLVKVFLVFQEMKAVGATPDLACYNALLRACARAGDVAQAHDVLRRIREDGLDPNDNSWRELIRAAGKARRSDLAEKTWDMALEYRGDDDHPVMWKPSVQSFGALAFAYLRHASATRDESLKRSLYEKVIIMYKDVLVGKEERRLNLIDRVALQENPRNMLLVLQAVVGLMDMTPEHPQVLRDLGTTIAQLKCFSEPVPHLLKDNRAATRALQVSRSWLPQKAQ